MKALTLWQPWASAIAIGAKRIETRSWTTSYRGHLAIHAATTTRGFEVAGTNQRLWREVLRVPRERSLQAALDDLPRAAVILVCNLESVAPVEACDASSLEQQLGDFSPGRFGWLRQPGHLGAHRRRRADAARARAACSRAALARRASELVKNRTSAARHSRPSS